MKAPEELHQFGRIYEERAPVSAAGPPAPPWWLVGECPTKYNTRYKIQKFLPDRGAIHTRSHSAAQSVLLEAPGTGSCTTSYIEYTGVDYACRKATDCEHPCSGVAWPQCHTLMPAMLPRAHTSVIPAHPAIICRTISSHHKKFVDEFLL